MAQFFQSVGDVLSTLGSSFCVPVMLFIIALFMGCKDRKRLELLYFVQLD